LQYAQRNTLPRIGAGASSVRRQERFGQISVSRFSVLVPALMKVLKPEMAPAWIIALEKLPVLSRRVA
jgi:hypothetical protein